MKMNLPKLNDPDRNDRLIQMRQLFHLDFHGAKFTVPKLSLFNLFEHQRGLFDATSYDVQSAVPIEIVELFVKALATGGRVPVTIENAGAVSLLAKEFWLEDLISECSVLQRASTPELIASLSVRISKLEGQISSQPLAGLSKLKKSIAHHERQLEGLRYRISALEPDFTNALTDLKELKPSSSAPISRPIPHKVAPCSPSTPHKEVEFPLEEARSIEGIISYLTEKHGGNVHDKGIVTITSKSIADEDRGDENFSDLADLPSYWGFQSKNEPDQWVCWDFHESRIRPTHYTIRSSSVKSWVVESSLDGLNWTEIDRKTDNSDFEPHGMASFAVSKSAECRFIRLTHTGKNQRGSNYLHIYAFEIFGALLE
jgi:hypothetical protein